MNRRVPALIAVVLQDAPHHVHLVHVLVNQEKVPRFYAVLKARLKEQTVAEVLAYCKKCLPQLDFQLVSSDALRDEAQRRYSDPGWPDRKEVDMPTDLG